MLTLSNGATVHAAFIVPASEGMKPNGLVLAETETDWVVWNVHWDYDLSEPKNWGEESNEVWEADNGHYFSKKYDPIHSGPPQEMAEFQFGLSLRRLLRPASHRGAKEPLR